MGQKQSSAPIDVRPLLCVQKLFTFNVLTCPMTPRRAVVVATWVTFVTGFVLAGYNGTSIYVWYTTGKVEILGGPHDNSYAPIFFAKALVQDYFGFLIGLCLLILAVFEIAALFLSKALTKKKKP